MIELAEPELGTVRVKVVGVGNAGGMIVKRIAREALPGVECAAVNTAIKDLGNVTEVRQLRIGAGFTKGHGAGMDPQVGRKAALEDANAIRDFLGDNDIVILVAGFGKGTGTGATPVVAELARENGALTLAFVTTPMPIETRKHHQNAAEGLAELKQKVDVYVPLSNERLFTMPGLSTLAQAWTYMDEVVLAAVRGLVEVIVRGGRMSHDLADLRTLLRGAGLSAFAMGAGKGEDRVAAAVRELAEFPFIDADRLGTARSLLANIAGGTDLTLHEIAELQAELQALTGAEPTLAPAIWQDESLQGEVRLTVLAAGLAETAAARAGDDLFLDRGLLRGSPIARGAAGPARPGRPGALAEAAVIAEEDLERPAYLRKPRPGLVPGPRG